MTVSGMQHQSVASSWTLTGSAFLIMALNGGSLYTFGLLMPELTNSLDTHETQTAWVGSLQQGLALGSALLVGGLVELLDCALVSCFGSLMVSLGFVISSQATSVSQLYFTLGIVVGIGCGLQFVPLPIIIQRRLGKKGAFKTGIVMSGAAFGTFAFAPFLVCLLDTYTWRGTYILMGAIVLHGIPLALLCREPKKKQIVPKVVTESPSVCISKDMGIDNMCHKESESDITSFKKYNIPADVSVLHHQKYTEVIANSSNKVYEKGNISPISQKLTPSEAHLLEDLASEADQHYPPQADKEQSTDGTYSTEDLVLQNISNILILKHDKQCFMQQTLPLENISNESKLVSLSWENMCVKDCNKEINHDPVAILLPNKELSIDMSHGSNDSPHKMTIIKDGENESLLPTYLSENSSHTEAGISACSLQKPQEHCRAFPQSIMSSHSTLYIAGDVDLNVTELKYSMPGEKAEHDVHLKCTFKTVKNHCFTIFDFSVMRDGPFWFIIVSFFLIGLGAPVPFVFLPRKALMSGLSAREASLALSFLGIGDAAGRIIFGLVALRMPSMRLLLVANLSMGVLCLLSQFTYDFVTLLCFAISYGLMFDFT